MGIAARHEKRYADGERLLREALAIDKRIGRSSKIAADLEELATGTQSAGNLKLSAEYLERAYTVNSAAGRLPQAIANQERLAAIYDLQGETSRASAARETAIKLSLQVKPQQPHGSSATTSPSSSP
jgi:tetratricopeptide (TPR) repeat protein